MPHTRDPIVYVVDDEEVVRDAVDWLLSSVGIAVRGYGSAAEFMEDYEPGYPGCLILDVRMPGMSGLELHDHLLEKQDPIPVIFLTGHGDIPMATRAMAAGAVQFFEKPFNNQLLLDAVQHAVSQSRKIIEADLRRRDVRARIDSLSRRQRQILDLIIDGTTNKVIAETLGISPRTVEVHRAKIMEKMNVTSIAALVRQVIETGGPPRS